MISNYLKVAIRAIFRNKLTAFINISGLAIAMTSAVLIYLFVADELGYDKYHPYADRTYRVTRKFFDNNGELRLQLSSIAPPIGPLLKNDFGEIEMLARTLNSRAVVGLEKDGELASNDENSLFFAEPDFFKIFDIQVVSGNPEEDFQKPFSVMLSEPTAMRYFNSTDIIGRRLRLYNRLDIVVTGVFKPFPLQTHFHPEFLVSFVTLEDTNVYGREGLETNWGNNAFTTYLVLNPGVDPKNLEARMPEFLDKHLGPFARANTKVPADFVASKVTQLNLQKITDIHLRSQLDDELEVNGNINNVYMMSVIGIFIILIACFNFINLSTARATKRAKEVGLRKVVGAVKNQLIGQYLSESVLIALFALVIAVGLATFSLSWLNDFTGKELSLAPGTHWRFYLGVMGFAVFVGLMAGIYPAFVISGFKPVAVLKGQAASGKGKASIRKALVIAQFGISIVLLIATAITFDQLSYLNKRNLGYDRDQVITLNYSRILAGNYDTFYNEMIKSSSIVNVARSSRIPTGRLLDSMGNLRTTHGDSLIDNSITLKYIAVDQEFFDTYGVKFVAGRNFSKSIPTDDSLAYIINEAAVKALGWKTNEEGINSDFQYGIALGKLIGVVQDFHFESLHQQVVPMIFIPQKRGGTNYIAIKMAAGQSKEGIAHLQNLWRSMAPGVPFSYQFLDERYQQLYESERKEGTLFTIFSGMAIAIACLGLFGLATFNTMQRIKEIGIRKVLGASVPSILQLLAREIIALVVIANLVAWPIAWYLMSRWLDSFAYHVDMNLLIYILAAFAAVLLALATVSAQTVKAALTNPANTLRYE